MANMVNATLFTLPFPTCFLVCMFAIHEPFQYLHICKKQICTNPFFRPVLEKHRENNLDLLERLSIVNYIANHQL